MAKAQKKVFGQSAKKTFFVRSCQKLAENQGFSLCTDAKVQLRTVSALGLKTHPKSVLENTSLLSMHSTCLLQKIIFLFSPTLDIFKVENSSDFFSFADFKTFWKFCKSDFLNKRDELYFLNHYSSKLNLSAKIEGLLFWYVFVSIRNGKII